MLFKLIILFVEEDYLGVCFFYEKAYIIFDQTILIFCANAKFKFLPNHNELKIAFPLIIIIVYYCIFNDQPKFKRQMLSCKLDADLLIICSENKACLMRMFTLGKFCIRKR